MSALPNIHASVSPDVLEAIEVLAKKEGRDVSSLLNEALRELLASRLRAEIPDDARQAYTASLNEYQSVYQRLAQ